MLKIATMVKHAPIAAPITVIKTLDGVISPHGQQKNTLILPELRVWLNWQLVGTRTSEIFLAYITR